jgi:hypothetical protein
MGLEAIFVSKERHKDDVTKLMYELYFSLKLVKCLNGKIQLLFGWTLQKTDLVLYCLDGRDDKNWKWSKLAVFGMRTCTSRRCFGLEFVYHEVCQRAVSGNY